MTVTTPVVVKIVGILAILEGILFLFKPALMKKIIDFFSRGKRLYLAGILRAVIAVIFLIAGSQCRLPAVIIALGILVLAAAIAMFVIKLDTQKAILNWWQQKSLTTLRLLSVIALLLGAVIVYSA